jgi:hypothetical protein
MRQTQRNRKATTSGRIDPDAVDPQDGPVLTATQRILDMIEGRADGPEVFMLTVGGAGALFFRYPKNQVDIEIFQREGFKFVGDMQSPEKRAKQPAHIKSALEKAKHADSADFINAFTLHYWSVKPEKITVAQAILFTRDPVVLDGLIRQIDQEHARGMQVMNLGGVDVAKKKIDADFGWECAVRASLTFFNGKIPEQLTDEERKAFPSAVALVILDHEREIKRLEAMFGPKS